MLIKKDADGDAESLTESADAPRRRAPGFFHCAAKFRTFFPLYHRSTGAQGVMTLESSILHNFAVSNRRGRFVYKDGRYIIDDSKVISICTVFVADRKYFVSSIIYLFLQRMTTFFT